MPIEAATTELLSPDLGFLPVSMSAELHANLIRLAFKWNLNTTRVVEQSAFERDLASGQRTQDYSPFLHLAVLAVGSRYIPSPPPEICSDAHDPETRGVPFLRAALALLTSELARPKLSTIKGLMTIALHLAGVKQLHTGWLYSGLAVRVAQDFGLHRDVPESYDQATRMGRRQTLHVTSSLPLSTTLLTLF
ncbi:hypothetical protein MNV49_000763 [Pseudohyphozyma bogoriensis]|nr:hypothetical protein MNV49_000763 [Pseudohyphozyma bogoriensis]